MKKRIVRLSAAILCSALLIGIAFGIYALCVTFSITNISIDTSKRFQTMRGFGASSAWVYQDLGASDDENLKNAAMEMLYGNTGLQLNTFRYNIGAGGAEVDGYEDKLRGAESFFKAETFNGDYSVFADESNYDFQNRDSAVLDLFDRALASGNIERVIFFANSPHYLMTKNGKTHGENYYDNNLKEECYTAFSQYLLTVTNYLYKNYICKYDKDIEVYISPVNEPQWKWGGEAATQEGCHFDPKPLARFYDVFYGELQEFNRVGKMDFQLDIFESGNYQMIKSTRTKFNEYMNEFSKYEFFDDIRHISVHSYGADTSVFYREIFADYMSRYYPDVEVSMSEYCTMEWGVDESIDMGIRCGKVIMRDIAMLNVSDWSYWLSIAKGGFEDGLVYWSQTNGSINKLDVTKRYYIMGHFSKYVSNGSRRVSSQYSDFLGLNGVESVAFKNIDGSITLVVLNDSAKSHRIKVKGVDGYNRVKEVMTDSDVNWQTRDYQFDGYIKVPSRSVSTYIFTK